MGRAKDWDRTESLMNENLISGMNSSAQTLLMPQPYALNIMPLYPTPLPLCLYAACLEEKSYFESAAFARAQ